MQNLSNKKMINTDIVDPDEFYNFGMHNFVS